MAEVSKPPRDLTSFEGRKWLESIQIEVNGLLSSQILLLDCGDSGALPISLIDIDLGDST